MVGNDRDKEITAQETAKQLGYHPHHVYRLLSNGAIKGRRFNRVWIIKQSEVDRVKALQDEHGRLWKA